MVLRGSHLGVTSLKRNVAYRQSVKTCFSWVCIFRRINKGGGEVQLIPGRDLEVEILLYCFLKEMLNLAEKYL